MVFFNGRHYPSSSFVEGDIVVQKKMVKGLSLEGQLFWLYTNSSGKLVHTQIDISLYPHLFRALNWWEYRKVEDMPKYVKPIVASQYVYEFVSMDKDSASSMLVRTHTGAVRPIYAGSVAIATEEEFLKRANS